MVHNFTDVGNQCDFGRDKLGVEVCERQSSINHRLAGYVKSIFPPIHTPGATELIKLSRQYSLHEVPVEPGF